MKAELDTKFPEDVVADIMANRRWKWTEGMPQKEQYKQYEMPAKLSSLTDEKAVSRTGRREPIDVSKPPHIHVYTHVTRLFPQIDQVWKRW